MNYVTLDVKTVKILAAICKDAHSRSSVNRMSFHHIYLDVVHERAVATNGHVLLMYPLGIVDSDELPINNNYPKPVPTLLPYVELLDALKLHKPGKQFLTCLENPIIGVLDGKPAVTIFQGVAPTTLFLPKTSEQYPMYEQVFIDETREHKTVCFSAVQLALLLKAEGKEKHYDRRVSFNIYDNAEKGATGFCTGEFSGLIMPLRQNS